jgi:hypothetical protein
MQSWRAGPDSDGRGFVWAARRILPHAAPPRPDFRSYGETAFCPRLSVTAVAVTATFASDAYYPIRNRRPLLASE